MTFILNLTALLLFFIPFQFALNINANIDLAILRLLILILFIIFIIIILYRKKIFIPQGLITLFGFLFLAWTTFSLFYTPVLNWTERKIFFLFSISLFFLILATLFHYFKKRGIIQLSKFLVGGIFLASIIALFQFIAQFIFGLNPILNFWLSLTPFFLGSSFSESVITYNSWLVNIGGITLLRATSFFPDPHIFSFYCGLIAPFSLALFQQTKKKIWLISFIIIILADLLTFTRGGYFGLLIGLLISLILFWPQINILTKHLFFLAMLGLLLILFIPNNFIVNRFNSSFNSVDNSVNHRLEIWQETGEIIKENLWLGVGLGAYSHIINPRADYRMPIYAHNTYLDIWVEVGLIGLTFFLGLLFFVFLNFYRHRRKIFPKFAIISLAIFTTHLFFDTPIFSVHILPIFIFILALASYYENQPITTTE
jgi:O-antigen ligase